MLIVILAASCIKRERLNPLDPENPETMGRPTGLGVVSIQDTVFLNWNLLQLRDLTGYQIYRKTSLESDFVRLAFSPRSENNFKDIGVQFNLEYAYQISAVGTDFESLRSDSVKIVPGPTFSWVADNGRRELLKLTHDSRHEILRIKHLNNVIDIEPNPVTGEVWIIDDILGIEGRIRKISSGGELDENFIAFPDPTDLSLDYLSGAVWVADPEQGRVTRLDSSLNSILTIDTLSRPSYVAVDQRTGNCWAADTESNSTVRISADGTQILTTGLIFSEIEWMTVNSQDGSFWVVDSARVVKADENGVLLFEIGAPLTNPERLAINENTGDVWIINSNPSVLYKFSASGERLFEAAGFISLGGLSINLFDNSVLVTEAQRSLLHKFSANGQRLNTFEEFIFPEFVAVQNTRQ